MKESIKKNKGILFASAAVVLSIAVVVVCGLMASCSNAGAVGDTGIGNAFELAGESALEGIELPNAAEGAECNEANEGFEIDAATDEESDDAVEHVEADASGDVPTQSAMPAASASSGSKHEPVASSSAPAPQRKWVEDYEQVWIEDSAAWTEQVPIYSSKEVSICNVCGVDVTGNATAHGKAHMLAGEGSGHHSEVVQTITGYDSVYHEAKGHYENRVIGGHWE